MNDKLFFGSVIGAASNFQSRMRISVKNIFVGMPAYRQLFLPVTKGVYSHFLTNLGFHKNFLSNAQNKIFHPDCLFFLPWRQDKSFFLLLGGKLLHQLHEMTFLSICPPPISWTVVAMCTVLCPSFSSCIRELEWTLFSSSPPDKRSMCSPRLRLRAPSRWERAYTHAQTGSGRTGRLPAEYTFL